MDEPKQEAVNALRTQLDDIARFVKRSSLRLTLVYENAARP